MSSPIVKVKYYVKGDLLVYAAWEIKHDPSQRLSKKSVMDLATKIYEYYGQGVDLMDIPDEIGEWFPNSPDWTDNQRDKITDWVEKQWPGATND